MEADEVYARMEQAGYHLAGRDRLPNDLGVQLRYSGGEIVLIYDTGKVVVQGKNRDPVLRVLEGSDTVDGHRVERVSHRVFVVYGHDLGARTELEAMLRRWGLEPLILDQLPSEGATVIEKLEKYASHEVSFAVVLATPDDVGFPAGRDDEAQHRARQNVILELGLLLGKLGRSRVAILLKNQEQMERPSDIQGLVYIPITDSVEDAKIQLAKEMAKQGIKLEVSKL